MYDSSIISNSSQELDYVRNLLIHYQIECNEEMEVRDYSYLSFQTISETTSLYILDAANPEVQRTIEKIREANPRHVVFLILDNLAQLQDIMKIITLPTALLLRPVCYSDLKEKLDMLKQFSTYGGCEQDTFFCWHIKSKIYSVPISSILYFESRDKKTVLHTKKTEYVLRKSLNAIERDVIHGFFRTHRSFLVNKCHIREYDTKKKCFTLDEGTRIPVSRNGRNRMEKRT